MRGRMDMSVLITLILSGIWAVPSFADGAQGEKEKSGYVLIVYSSGIPFKTISKIKAKEVDAVTFPTPKRWNCRTIAEKLA